MGAVARKADDEDLRALIGLRRAWSEENAGGAIDDPAFSANFTAWFRSEAATRTFFLVEVDGTAVGMGNIKRYDRMPVPGRERGGHWGYVGNVFVLPPYRNAGVGRVLMDELIGWAWAKGMEHLRLANAADAASFYDRLGFRPGAVVELDPPPS